MCSGVTFFVDQGAQRVAVYVVGDDAHAQAGHHLEVVDHDNIGVGEIISHFKFLFKHSLKLGLVAKLGLECLEHCPFAIFLGGVHIIELLVPLGEVLNLGPFFGRIAHIHLFCAKIEKKIQYILF